MQTGVLHRSNCLRHIPICPLKSLPLSLDQIVLLKDISKDFLDHASMEMEGLIQENLRLKKVIEDLNSEMISMR